MNEQLRKHTSGPILVSACLLGEACRYDRSHCRHEGVARLAAEGRAIPVCPEMLGGLGAPRPPAEIVGGDGAAVLNGRAKVVDREGRDLTGAFVYGAELALAEAKRHGAAAALLKEGSPSCGVRRINGGTPGKGVTAALLELEGLAVYSEEDVD
ncbi:MAG: DUF523 domain-containing protein [Patescibacteria group bacterium]